MPGWLARWLAGWLAGAPSFWTPWELAQAWRGWGWTLLFIQRSFQMWRWLGAQDKGALLRIENCRKAKSLKLTGG